MQDSWQAIDLTLADGTGVSAFDSGGPRARPAVVLLHGIGMSHLTWAELQPRLAGAARVVSLDLPGFGRTRKPDRPFAVADFAAAANEALGLIGVGPRVLVGHSMGAQFAVECAAQQPALAAGLVLVGPVVNDERRSVREQSLDLGLDTLREPPGVNARVLTDYFRGGVGWYLSTLRAMLAYPIERRIATVPCPVVVLRGELDPIAPLPWCLRLAGRAPAPSTVVTVPARAHVIPLTAPESVARAALSLGPPRAES